jgi:TetR/AcrR family transcriptional repressor of nem operon
VGVSKEQAAQNRRDIIATANRLFRERGVTAVGLSELMQAAGFTQGGFYNHFESKDALVTEVVGAAMGEGKSEFVAAFSKATHDEPGGLARYNEHYLSKEHRDDIQGGCPVAGFAGIAPQLTECAQSNFVSGLDDLITLIAGLIVRDPAYDAGQCARSLRQQAIDHYCKLLGALMLSRATARSSPQLADEILESVELSL